MNRTRYRLAGANALRPDISSRSLQSRGWPFIVSM